MSVIGSYESNCSKKSPNILHSQTTVHKWHSKKKMCQWFVHIRRVNDMFI